METLFRPLLPSLTYGSLSSLAASQCSSYRRYLVIKQRQAFSNIEYNTGSSEEDEIERCIGALDEILDLYDADDDDDAELYRSRQSDGDVSAHLLPLRSCARVASRNREIRKSTHAGVADETQITEVEEVDDEVEETSSISNDYNISNKSSSKSSNERLRRMWNGQLTVNCSRSSEMLDLNWRIARGLDLDQIVSWQSEIEELYARRKQMLQLPPSTVSSSDSAVFLQCNETEQFEMFSATPSMQDDRSNPDSGYLVNTDEDSVASVDLSVTGAGGSKRSAASDSSSRLTSLRSCRWLMSTTGNDMSAPTVESTVGDDDDTAAPSSGSTLTNASSSHKSSLMTAADVDDAMSVFEHDDFRHQLSRVATSADGGDVESVYDELDMALDAIDGTLHRDDRAPTPSRPFPPPPPSPSLKPSATVCDMDLDELDVFPPPPPLLLPTIVAASPSSSTSGHVILKKMPPPPTPPKPSKTPTVSVSSSGAGSFEFRSLSPSSSSSLSVGRHAGSRSLVPPPPPTLPLPSAAVAAMPPPTLPVAAQRLPSASVPPPPPPRPPTALSADFPPSPTTFPSVPAPSNTERRTSTAAPPPPPRRLSVRDDDTGDKAVSTVGDEFSDYSTISELMYGRDEAEIGDGGLAAALRGVKLRIVTGTDKSPSSVKSPLVAGQTDAMSALVNQLHSGVQLRPTTLGHRIRGVDSTPAVSSPEASESSFQAAAGDEEYTNHSELPLPVRPSMVKPPPPVPPKKAVPRRLTASSNSLAAEHLDVTQLPGYQVIPADCPQWKRAIIEKKNATIVADATKEHEAKKQEEERWKNVPEWKRNLITKRQERENVTNTWLRLLSSNTSE